MPQQKRERRVDAKEVQGEGAYVLMRPLTYGESKEIRHAASDMNGDDKLATTEKLITDHLIGWNWGDPDGESLPLPSEDKTVFSRLTNEEMNFLGKALHGDPNG